MVFQKYINIAIVCTFVTLVAIQANKNFVLDEIDFPIVSHATSQTLKPIYYRGEGAEQHVGTYHPTLYINSLAVFIRIFGYSEVSVRIFGIVCTLVSAFLLLKIFRLLTKKNSRAEVLFLGLFLFNPYTIANTTLPDIDSTVMPVVILLFLYASLYYLHKKKDMSKRVVLILGCIFGLALWSKLTTPLIIPLFLFILATITSKKYKDNLLFTFKVATLGILIFAVSYFLYCKLFGLSTTYTYTFLIDSFTKGTNADGPLVGALNNLKNIGHLIYWLTLPFVGLLGVSFFSMVFDKDKDYNNKIKKLLVATAVLVSIFYIALISPFGGFFKYPFATFGLLTLSIIFFYERYFADIKLKF